MIEDDSSLRYSISCTTRQPRGHEENGVHYHFLTQAEFDASRSRGEFMESAEVHGYSYGTLEAPVRIALQAGQGVILAIDVQGAAQIRKRIAAFESGDLLRRSYLDIFILPPSIEILADRLRHRGEDPEDVIQRRLRNAASEIQQSDKYQYRVVNDDFEVAYRHLREIIAAERLRRSAI